MNVAQFSLGIKLEIDGIPPSITYKIKRVQIWWVRKQNKNLTLCIPPLIAHELPILKSVLFNAVLLKKSIYCLFGRTSW